MTAIITALYFFLPAFAANMAPAIAAAFKLPAAEPLSEKQFGSHKTIRGLYAGYCAALLMLWIQLLIQRNGSFEAYRLLDYTTLNLVWYAFLFGIGALGGDLLKSYFKRRLGIAPGRPWPVFDQLDFVVGGLVFVYLAYPFPLYVAVILLIITPVLHLLTNVISYFLGLKEVWW